jgi:hypothetical protein
MAFGGADDYEEENTVLFLVLLIPATLCMALDQWEYKLTSETPKLINSPFFLMSAADLDKNGIKN